MEARVCSVKSCKRVPDGNYKQCEYHRELQASRKRKRRAKTDDLDGRLAICSGCTVKVSKDEMIGAFCVKCKFRDYKRKALIKGKCFELTLPTFQMLCNQPCFWCGLDGKPAHGVDRRDNTQGYTIQNAKPCCSVCNYGKNDTSEEDFINMCVKVAVKHSSLEKLQFLFENKQK